MNLEDQCVSLQLSKRLKELGVKQESYFFWFDGSKHEYVYHNENENIYRDYPQAEIICSAYTVAELGEMLPHKIRNKFFLYHKDKEGHSISYKDINNQIHYFGKFDKSEANCRAKMLIYLLENGFIKI